MAGNLVVSTINGVAIGVLNAIINGNFGINQRGVSGTVTLAAGVYGHDRWKAGASGCTYTFATVDNVTTLTISAGSLIQVIEGLNLQSGTYTLSWTGTAQGKIGAGSYGASGITGTAVGGTNLNIEFGTGTVSLVQLEKGSTATPFEFRSIGQELALAQRYYWRSGNGGLFSTLGSSVVVGSSTINGFSVKTPVTMRASPTSTVSNLRVYDGSTAVSVSSIAATWSSTDCVGLDLNTGSGLTIGRNAVVQYNNSATAYVDASSEL